MYAWSENMKWDAQTVLQDLGFFSAMRWKEYINHYATSETYVLAQ